MASEIKCPNCGHPFPMEEAVAEEYKKELRKKMEEFVRSKDAEFKLKQQEFAAREKELLMQAQQQENQLRRKMEEEKMQLQKTLEESLRKSITAGYETELQLLKKSNEENEERLKEARRQQLEYLQKEEALKRKEEELELSVQKKVMEERSRLTEEIRRMEEQKIATREMEFSMKVKELEKQLDDQKKLAEEMRRKAEQGSMQLQGEVQELALEAMLKAVHPFDLVEEVGKGVRGADCIQTVRNNFGQECGKIIYESKRTKEFSNEWIEKLKNDKLGLKADFAILVTQTMPRDMTDGFGEKNGVWICTYNEVKALSTVIRETIIKIAQAARSQENRGDKMHMLYDYLTGNEFSSQWKAIREGFLSMKMSIQKERDAMEKLWKAREKQLEKVLLNAAHVKGSIEGIAGQDSIDLNLLDDGDEERLLEN